MKLTELAKSLSPVESYGDLNVEIGDLGYRSAEAIPGTLFFCVAGFTLDGHDFARAAVEAGAVGLAVERKLELDVPQLVVEDSRTAMASCAKVFFGDPAEGLTLVAITGTNGKTTTAYLIRSILESSGTPCGLLGTVEQIVGSNSEPVERTTPEAIDLYRLLSRMRLAGDRACVMEVSSHALELERSTGIEFDCAVFTNLTQDHLDFHATMDDYFKAKRKLFLPSSGAPPAKAVVNIDDRYGLKLADELRASGMTPATYSLEGDADFWVKQTAQDGRLLCLFKGQNQLLEVPFKLEGRFNIQNALAASATACELGLRPSDIGIGLSKVTAVPGRFETVDRGQPFQVIVDYAHTPDSLDNVLVAARELTEGRLICVFGCGGDRDRDKRAQMGRIAAEGADLVFVTSDNPRSEDPQAIVDEIVVGIDSVDGGNSKSSVVIDRREAIALAVDTALDEDLVLIAGKGHEQGQEFADRKIPFDDRRVAEAELERRVGLANGSAVSPDQ